MRTATILTLMRQWIASIGWKLFIWGNNTTQEEYWKQIQEQENNFSFGNRFRDPKGNKLNYNDALKVLETGYYIYLSKHDDEISDN